MFLNELAPGTLTQDQIEMWAARGRMLYGVETAKQAVLFRVLDDASRGLVMRLHNAAPPELRVSAEDLDAVMARLEQTIVADTALNHLRVRPQISSEIARRGGQIDFQTLNSWIYKEIFRTPAEDPWLGLLQRDVFAGLPGDGVALRAAHGAVRGPSAP